jgi:hypothetical protein
MEVRGRGINIGVPLILVMLSFLMPTPAARGGSKDKVFESGSNYIFIGGWTKKEVETITRLQDKARELLQLCQGYITPEEKSKILNTYNKSFILHIKNNNLGENIGASVASTRRSMDNAVPLAMDVVYSYKYSAIQINVKELFPRGEKEILKTLLHEMAHNASPLYSHPRMEDIWDLRTGKLKEGRKRSEYYDTVPLRVENCVRSNDFAYPKF